MYYVFVMLSLAVAGELEVSGSLKVSEGIDAQGQTISNVGSAVLDSDATNLSTVRSMLGMKPTRIYRKVDSNFFNASYTVPSNRFWLIKYSGYCININAANDGPAPEGWSFILFADDVLNISGANNSTCDPEDGSYTLTIYEYPFSASGSDQGLEYIEP